MKRFVAGCFWVGAFVALCPLSWWLLDRVWVTQPFTPGAGGVVLLVAADHIQIRFFRDLTEVSPRAAGDPYTFSVPPEREEWVREQLRKYPPPVHGAGWLISIDQMGGNRQKIGLDVMHDGIIGTTYEAHPTEIVPKYSRGTGPGFPLVVLCLTTGLWLALKGAVKLAVCCSSSPEA